MVLVDDRTVVDGCTATECPDPESLGGLLAAVLLAEGVPRGSEAGLHLVGAEEMAELNLDAMGKDGPTDVLSFPLDGVSAVGGADDGVDAGGRNGVGAVPHLVGDVVLCTEVAMRNASRHAGTMGDECRLLVVHGGLHLCGWDHETPRQQHDMWTRERELMASLGVSPSGDPWSPQ
jgi:probable rRNA maturation factor